MEIQNIIAYIILTGTIVFSLWKLVKTFLIKKAVSSCDSGGCSGCDVKNKCGSTS